MYPVCMCTTVPVPVQYMYVVCMYTYRVLYLHCTCTTLVRYMYRIYTYSSVCCLRKECEKNDFFLIFVKAVEAPISFSISIISLKLVWYYFILVWYYVVLKRKGTARFEPHEI